MAVKLAPVGDVRPQFFDDQGNVLNGGLLFFYAVGSANKENTYTTSTGLVANPNPVELDADGRAPNGIWFTEGQSYKVVAAPANDTDPPTSPFWTEDNVSGINDASLTIDQWEDGPDPTYVSATSFTLAGDQTSTALPNRAVKLTDSGGTDFSRIKTSVFTSLTTVTIYDSVLDSGLSALSYGVVTPTQTSLPILPDTNAIISGSADTTKLVRLEADELTTATTRVLTVADVDGRIAVSTLMPGTIGGLIQSNNAGDANNDIDISAGTALDATSAHWLRLASSITKRLDANWAVGTNQGGLDTGTKANSTWYYLWLIMRSDTHVVDVLFSTSSSAPTMPASYDIKRLVGAVLTDGSGNLLGFKAYETAGSGLLVVWNSKVLDINVSNGLTSTARLDTVSVPVLPVKVRFRLSVSDSAGSIAYSITGPGETDQLPNSLAVPGSDIVLSGSNNLLVTNLERFTDTGQIRARASGLTTDDYIVATISWEWGRR